MSDFHEAPPISFDELLRYVSEDALADVPLPDINDSPYDTSVIGPNELEVLNRIEPYKNTTYDIRESLRPGFAGWQDGDTVRGTFTVGLDPHNDTRTVLRADTYPMGGGRLHQQLDRGGGGFTLDDLYHSLDEEQEIAISELGLTKFIADALIQLRRGVSHCVAVTAIHALQRPFDGNEAALYENQSVLVQGTLVDTQFGDPYLGYPADSPDSPWVKVTLPDGKQCTVYLDYERVRYNSSSLRVSHRADTRDVTLPHPTPGDQVQLAATYRRHTTNSRQPSLILANNRGSIHLLNHDDKRFVADFGATEELKDSFIPKITAASNPSVIRNLFGMFVGQRLAQSQTIDSFDMSEADMALLQETVETSLTSLSEQEYPVALPLNASVIKNLVDIQRIYGLDNVFALSNAEFQALALKAAAGQQPIVVVEPSGPQRTNMAAMFFNTFKPQLPIGAQPVDAGNPLMLRAMTLRVLSAQYPDFKERAAAAAADASAQPARYDSLAEWCVAAIEHLPDMGIDPHSAAELLIARSEDIFNDSETLLSLNQQLREPLLEALRSCLLKCGDWGEDNSIISISDTWRQSKNLQRIADEALFEKYEQALPGILRTIAQANESASGYLKGRYDHAVTSIRQILQILQAKKYGN